MTNYIGTNIVTLGDFKIKDNKNALKIIEKIIKMSKKHGLVITSVEGSEGSQITYTFKKCTFSNVG